MYGRLLLIHAWISMLKLGMDEQLHTIDLPDSKVHGANMGPIWAHRSQVGPMLAPWTLLSGLPATFLTVNHIIDLFNITNVSVHSIQYIFHMKNIFIQATSFHLLIMIYLAWSHTLLSLMWIPTTFHSPKSVKVSIWPAICPNTIWTGQRKKGNTDMQIQCSGKKHPKLRSTWTDIS